MVRRNYPSEPSCLSNSKFGVAELGDEIENSISETLILCNATRLPAFRISALLRSLDH